jgi:hypothetical protein
MIRFNEQRFCHLDKSDASSYLQLTNHRLNGFRTEGFEELVCRHSLDCSFSKVVEIMEDITAENQLSDQKAQQIVVAKATMVNLKQLRQAQETIFSHDLPIINSCVDIYSSEIEEVIVEIDAVLSKKQKEKRDKAPPEHKSFVTNMLGLIGLQKEKMTCFIGASSPNDPTYLPLSDYLMAHLMTKFGQSKTGLNIVAINDGAKDIRTLLMLTFGVSVTVILDWYHLTKKMKEYMSMFGMERKQKEIHFKEILQLLWHGKLSFAITYLLFLEVKNDEKKLELIAYLEKHETEIIDYDQRKKVGKTIGSGKVEKLCDEIVAQRQKNKAMSWSEKGSKSIAILTTIRYNQQWHSIWNLKNAA